jgi:hypothetical protein
MYILAWGIDVSTGFFFWEGGLFVLLLFFFGGGFLYFGWILVIFRHWHFFFKFHSYLTCYDSCVKVPVQKYNKWERIILQS